MKTMSVSDFREKVFAVSGSPAKFLPLTVTRGGLPCFVITKAPTTKPAKKAAPKKK